MKTIQFRTSGQITSNPRTGLGLFLSIRRILSIAAVCAFVIAACSRAPQAPSKEVKITGTDAMKFDVTAFEVKPGQAVSVTLTNIGKLPKDAMGHDFMLLDKNTDVAKFTETGAAHKETNYVPPDQAFRVLIRTKILGPGETDTVTFTAPQVPGPYVYICSFPGHYVSGMKGIMTVAP